VNYAEEEGRGDICFEEKVVVFARETGRGCCMSLMGLSLFFWHGECIVVGLVKRELAQVYKACILF
jgi:hypothetical protein